MILRCYVDEETLTWLRRASNETGRTLEELAEAAIANAAIEYKRTAPKTAMGEKQ